MFPAGHDALVGAILGSILTIVLGIVANLLTPTVKPLWAGFLDIQRRGRDAETRKKIAQLQGELDRVRRFGQSERDLVLYLFRWLLGIIAIFGAAAVFAMVAVFTNVASARSLLLNVSLVLFLTTGVAAFVMLVWCGHLTSVGLPKYIAKLEANIAGLRATLSSQ
jgi:polyferredoxin